VLQQVTGRNPHRLLLGKGARDGVINEEKQVLSIPPIVMIPQGYTTQLRLNSTVMSPLEALEAIHGEAICTRLGSCRASL